MSQNEQNKNNDANNSNPENANKYVPWPVRKGIFRSIGQNDFVVPNRETSPIVEMPMTPSSTRSSPARFIPGYNRSMSPRITIEESPLSPPPLVTSPPPVLCHHPSPPPRVQSPPPQATPTTPVSTASNSPCTPNNNPVVRDVPIQQVPPVRARSEVKSQLTRGSGSADYRSSIRIHC